MKATSPIARQPRFDELLKVLRRSGKPDHLPFYEHIASPNFIAQRTGIDLNTLVRCSRTDYWRILVDFWLGMGYDCIPMEVPLNCPLGTAAKAESEGSESRAVIRNWEDFEAYAWPDESHPLDFSHFEIVAAMLPEGAKIVAGVCTGPYEWVSQMMGVVGLAYALVDNPGLVEAMFQRVGRLICSADRQLATMDTIGALRQGDDLGFKTSTFLSPELLRKLVFPIYRTMAELAHTQDKPFILHSCGNLSEVYDDLIDYCRIDAKHSFEDVILPVSEFKRQYGDRVTPLGGLDVDVICRTSGEELRAYVREHIEQCFGDGYWALGTGNSLTDYMPVENYITVLDEGIRVTG